MKICYVGKATKIFIFIVTVLVVTGFVLGFGFFRHGFHKSHKCTDSSCGSAPSQPPSFYRPPDSNPNPNPPPATNPYPPENPNPNPPPNFNAYPPPPSPISRTPPPSTPPPSPPAPPPSTPSPPPPSPPPPMTAAPPTYKSPSPVGGASPSPLHAWFGSVCFLN
ncbi:hypothetical protein Ancab_010944 [Ancistrocladus abbreviatus]